jgi:hypothetical protein
MHPNKNKEKVSFLVSLQKRRKGRDTSFLVSLQKRRKGMDTSFLTKT